jgi:hypothetical protein
MDRGGPSWTGGSAGCLMICLFICVVGFFIARSCEQSGPIFGDRPAESK